MRFQEPSGIYKWEPLQPQSFKDKEVPPWCQTWFLLS